MSCLKSDIAALRLMAVERCPQLLVSVTEVVCAFAFCFVISWKLSLVSALIERNELVLRIVDPHFV